MVSRRVRVGDVELAYDAAGSGAAVVLLHGFPMDRRLWEAQLAGLGEWWCIAPDLRGLGGSELGRRPVTMMQYADDVAALLDALGIGRTVVCGLSLGGYVAFELLRRHPDRIRALILSDTRAEADSADARRARDELVEAVGREGSGVLFDRMGPRLLSPGTWRAAPQAVKRLERMVREAPPAGVTAALLAARDRADSRDLLAGINVPTLVLVGADDAITPPEAVLELAERIRGARVVRIAGAGHMPPLERPEETTAAIGEFLRTLR